MDQQEHLVSTVQCKSARISRHIVEVCERENFLMAITFRDFSGVFVHIPVCCNPHNWAYLLLTS